MTAPDFDGQTYDHDRDYRRLASMLGRVQTRMADGRWHTLAELARATGGTEAAVSARLRDLRKPKFGGHTVERRYVADGLWQYRYTPNDSEGCTHDAGSRRDDRPSADWAGRNVTLGY